MGKRFAGTSATTRFLGALWKSAVHCPSPDPHSMTVSWTVIDSAVNWTGAGPAGACGAGVALLQPKVERAKEVTTMSNSFMINILSWSPSFGCES